MFDSLNEQMREHEVKGATNQQRVMHWVVIGVIATAVIAGVFAGISLMH